VGSISPLNMAAFHAAGANGFGIGSALFKPGMTPAQVAESAATFEAAWAGTMQA
jgi:2-dehydro-3-deoxyphosphogalactonate aldolase